ncbi:plastocyanin/azurin family copper-binding protein [Hwangdonia lutea]|uniref:Plastocyanin/azurin family copper-binding protein n=1 Tax=Hwangdonia lutea TaxID=3075823 RepID=A0AA97EMJ4_9FLAO|nr:plastocyanin/azurin family copper-binding protein [Hwangdonia sp. SCSIO 19198]WOD43205.1 plastocyanin/azurin family copper-binding protein [Hwangdonia sp. SCSIO 19198]
MRTHKSLISKYLLVFAALILLIMFFIGFKTPENNVGLSETSTTHTVTIFRMKFNPAHLTVKKGDTVVWINKDFVPHDVTEELNQKWTSKPFNKGEKWSKVIHEDIKYFCNLHKVMKGTITLAK